MLSCILVIYVLLEVSILVFVELALDEPPSGKPEHQPTVSILVFVELALDAYLMRSAESSSIRFNPCFRGTCSWWGRVKTRLPPWSMFQSLFSWNLLLMSGCLLLIELFWNSFNPCFRGTCSWWLNIPHSSLLLFMFQSLFSWNLLLMSSPIRTKPKRERVSILVFVELALDVLLAWL